MTIMKDHEEYLKASKVNKLRELNELLENTIIKPVDDIEPIFAIIIAGAVDHVINNKHDADLVCAQLNADSSFAEKVYVMRLWNVGSHDAVTVPNGESKCCGAPYMINGELQVEELGN
jgi:hypothetical protein